MSKIEPFKRITVSTEMLFPDAASLTGVVERRSDEGFIIRASKTGNITKYSATDADGNPLEGMYLRTSDGAPQATEGDHCFYCVVYQGTPYCTEVLCPEAAEMKGSNK